MVLEDLYQETFFYQSCHDEIDITELFFLDNETDKSSNLSI